MRVSGAATVHAPAEAVWAALADRDMLARSIPGCEQLDVTGDGRCRFTVTTTIAAVSGTYAGEASVAELDRASRVRLTMSAAGAKGSVSAAVSLRLAPAGDGATEVGYEADAEVGGAIAGIGQRLLASIGKRMAAQFLGALDSAIAAPLLTGDPLVPAAESLASRPAMNNGTGGQRRPAGEPVPQSVVELARRGTWLRGETGPALDRTQAGAWPGRGVRTGLLAGAAAGLAGILIGAVLGRRNRASGRGSR